MVDAVRCLGVGLCAVRDSSPEEQRPLFHQARLVLSQHLAPREDGDFGSLVMKWFDDMLDTDELETLHVMCQRFLRCLEEHVQPPADEDDEGDEGWYDSADEDEDEDEGALVGYVDTGKF